MKRKKHLGQTSHSGHGCKITTWLLVFTLVVTVGYAQQKPPFWTDIQNFRKQDSINFPATNAILFVGSSSFTNWKDVQTYFPGYSIINRGFGGSTLTDLIRYEKDVIFPYQPRQIVIYCGENDVASSDTIKAITVVNRFRQLFTDIRKKMPGVPVVFVSLKPSPSRWHLREKVKQVNSMIEKYLKKQKQTEFVNVWTPMLGRDGQPVKELFVEDNLHMNAKGYAIWQKQIQPALLKDKK